MPPAPTATKAASPQTSMIRYGPSPPSPRIVASHGWRSSSTLPMRPEFLRVPREAEGAVTRAAVGHATTGAFFLFQARNEAPQGSIASVPGTKAAAVLWRDPPMVLGKTLGCAVAAELRQRTETIASGLGRRRLGHTITQSSHARNRSGGITTGGTDQAGCWKERGWASHSLWPRSRASSSCSPSATMGVMAMFGFVATSRERAARVAASAAETSRAERHHWSPARARKTAAETRHRRDHPPGISATTTGRAARAASAKMFVGRREALVASVDGGG